MSEEKTLQIQGMTCAACSNRIEKVISKLDGVEKANVNLALERSTIVYDPARINVDGIINRIETLGYHVITEKIEFDIEGMSRSACAASIERRLRKIPGVLHAHVNFALESVIVEYDEKQVTPRQMADTGRQIGYTLIQKQSNQEKIFIKRRKSKNSGTSF